jgi:hypothetical protein
MILHLVPDEKFIDAAYRAFEEANPDNNEFVIISKKHPLRFIKNTPIRFVERSEFWSKKFVNSLKNYEMVCLHWLDDAKMQLLAQADASVKFVWIGWGGDYYDLITGDTTKLLKPKTLALSQKHRIQASSLPFKSKIKQIIKQIIYKKVEKQHIINRIDFFAPVLYEDYELLIKTIPDFTPRYLSWNYGTLEDDMIKGFEDYVISGNNILIGNSATYENNHLDVFEHLKHLNLGSRQILAPLSYGDTQYRDLVALEAKMLFGKQFVSVEGFMPIAEYVSILSSCSVAIMGHLRQQALGNIVIMIYLGAKVFLDKHNPVYLFFKKYNTFIYTLEEIETQIDNALTIEEVEFNRNILRQHWSREMILQKTNNLIKMIKEKDDV